MADGLIIIDIIIIIIIIIFVPNRFWQLHRLI